VVQTTDLLINLKDINEDQDGEKGQAMELETEMEERETAGIGEKLLLQEAIIEELTEPTKE